MSARKVRNSKKYHKRVLKRIYGSDAAPGYTNELMKSDLRCKSKCKDPGEGTNGGNSKPRRTHSIKVSIIEQLTLGLMEQCQGPIRKFENRWRVRLWR
jgi:hypothetical protein